MKEIEQPKSKIVVLDYGTGNLSSIRRILVSLSVGVVISSSPADVAIADKIVMPGVGHFDTAMRSLHDLGLVKALNDAVFVRRRPILGICLGMELMADSSQEGNAVGLSWFNACAVRFNVSDPLRFKVPHMGWNTVLNRRPGPLLEGVANNAEFYFAHAYHLDLLDPKGVLAETTYEYNFPSVIQKGNIFGVQFHPEKSHDAGARIFRNFVDLP